MLSRSRRRLLPLVGLLLALAGAPAVARADAPDAVASIKPIHSLLAAVMEGVGEPTLLLQGAASPHTYALKPSEAALLESADIVFWVGEPIETFLHGPLETLASAAEVVELLDAPGLVLLPSREGGVWEADVHEEAEHAEAHGAEDHADHEDHAAEEGEGHHEGDHHGEIDGHIWLDPINAMAMADAMAAALAALDPAHAETYRSNAAKLRGELEVLDQAMAARLSPMDGRPFIVFHDAYQYFEARYGLGGVGSITVNPEQAPGAERLIELREKIAQSGAICVFSEPQFPMTLVTTITEGLETRIGQVDPLGAGLEDGPNLYRQLIETLAGSIESCLVPAG